MLRKIGPWYLKVWKTKQGTTSQLTRGQVSLHWLLHYLKYWSMSYFCEFFKCQSCRLLQITPTQNAGYNCQDVVICHCRPSHHPEQAEQFHCMTSVHHYQCPVTEMQLGKIWCVIWSVHVWHRPCGPIQQNSKRFKLKTQNICLHFKVSCKRFCLVYEISLFYSVFWLHFFLCKAENILLSIVRFWSKHKSVDLPWYSWFNRNTSGNLIVWTFPTILCPRIQRRFRTSWAGTAER